MHLSRSTLISIAVAVVVLGAGAYYIWGMQKPDSGTTISVSGAPGADPGGIFVNLSANLDSISFDTTIMADPRFTALQDLHTSIVSEASGRKDPFAPIPGVVSSK